MKKHLLLTLFLLSTVCLFSQELVGVSVGSGYSLQAYYKLSDDDATEILDNTDWDIAFTAIGGDDAGIHVNESSKTSFANPTQPDVELYAAPSDDFSASIDPADLTERLFNDEKKWEYGAVNHGRDESNPDDFGWGVSDGGAIAGTKVFAIKLRSGTWKKFQVLSLENGVYSMKYADLDGAGETTVSIDKADYGSSKFAYFSFAENGMADGPANDWDLVFQRYITPIEDNTGTLVDFAVTGVLSGIGVQVAEAAGVDPTDIDFADWQDSLQSDIDIIGYDWKSFDNGWTLADDLVFFVKTTDGNIWQVRFVDFGGSSSGNIVFEKTDLGGASPTRSPDSNFAELNVFPNPVSSEVSLVFTLKKAVGTVHVSIQNIWGQKVWAGHKTAGQKGLNALSINGLSLSSGTYILTIETSGESISRKIEVRGER